MIKRRNLTVLQKAAFSDTLEADLLAGRMTMAQAIRKLRLELLGVDQAKFAQICRVSTRTVKELEAGRGNPTLQTVNNVLSPFGFKLGVVRRST